MLPNNKHNELNSESNINNKEKINSQYSNSHIYSKNNYTSSHFTRLDDYDSQEDLENLIRVSQCLNKKPKNFDNSDEESISIKSIKYFKQNKSDAKIFTTYRILNTLSIIILLLTFYSTTISQIKDKKEYSFIIEFLRRDKIQAESNLIVLSIAFCLVTFSSIIAIARNAIITPDNKDSSLTDIQATITKHFKYFYFTGNFLFAFCLIANHIRVLEEYGVNLFICIGTLICYYMAYYNHKVKGENLKLKGIFNEIAFSYNISFLLAWNATYLTITIATFLGCLNIPLSYINLVNLSLQGLLTILVVLALSYFHDLGFSFIILFFQWGNTLNENVFQFKRFDLKKEKEELDEIDNIRDEFNLNLILTLFSTICFLSSVMFYYMKRGYRKKDMSMDIDELVENYKVEGEKNYL